MLTTNTDILYETEPLVYFTTLPPNDADESYNFNLLVESVNEQPINRIVYELCGNVLDSYTVDLWPEAAPKRTNNILVYKLDFWFNNWLTPFTYVSHPYGNRFIYVYTKVPCKLSIQCTGITYYANNYIVFRDKTRTSTMYNITTHVELYNNSIFSLIRPKSYIIYGDFTNVTSIQTTDGTYTIDSTAKSVAMDVNGLHQTYNIKIIGSSQLFTIIYKKYNFCMQNDGSCMLYYSD